MGNENEMSARIKAEQAAKAKAAAARVNKARDAAIAKTKEKSDALKKVQADILAKRKAAAAGAQNVTKTIGPAAMAGVGKSKPVAAAMSGMSMMPAAGPAISAEYTVKKGDTLSQIAKDFYGVTNPKVWKFIQDANKDLIKDVNLIYPGQVFKMPALPEDLKKK